MQVTKPKILALPNIAVKNGNASGVGKDTCITLSPLLTCIESEQQSSESQGWLNISYIKIAHGVHRAF